MDDNAFVRAKAQYVTSTTFCILIRPWAPISKLDHPLKGREAAFYTGNLSDPVTVLTLF